MSSLTKELVEEWLKKSITVQISAGKIPVFTVSKDIEYIEKDAFLPLSYIDSMVIASENPDFPVENNCLYCAETGRLFFAAGKNSDSEIQKEMVVQLPAQIKEINLYAFPAGVHKIEVPSGVQEIPIKAAKAADLKSFIEERNQKVKAKREKIQAIMRLKQGKLS